LATQEDEIVYSTVPQASYSAYMGLANFTQTRQVREDPGGSLLPSVAPLPKTRVVKSKRRREKKMPS
jgi:hypothetical protein